jgi:hypothetical protein
MSDDRCSPFRENLAAYALNALDAGEIPALEEHLQGCEDCQKELAELRKVSDGLLFAAPHRRPPAHLRRQLAGRIEREAHPAVKAPRRWPFLQTALGALILILVGLNVYSVFQVREVQRQQDLLANQVRAGKVAISMLAYPATRSLPVEGENVSGSLLLDQERNLAALIVWNLPGLPADKTYQIWLIDPQGERTSAGIFMPEEGDVYTTVLFQLTGKSTDYVGIGVTTEPAGGSSGPTGPKVLGVTF